MEIKVVKKQNVWMYKIKKFFLKYWKPILISFGSVFLVSLLGGLFVDSDSVWFNSLIKPEFYPPNWLFSVMWTLLYLLVAIGLLLLIVNKKLTKKLTFLYIMNGVLNIVWNIVFWTFENLFLGVIVLVILIIFAYFLIKELYLVQKPSFYLTLPYFVWLFFAFLLNYSIYFLN